MDALYPKVQAFQDRFHERHGSTNCSVLLGRGLSTEGGQEHFKKNLLHLDCREYVGDAVEILQSIF